MRMACGLALVGWVLMLTGPALAGEKKPTITGKILFKEKPTFPKGTEILLEVQDTSRADAKAVVIGKKTMKDPKELSAIPFEVEYDGEKVLARGRYSLMVRITHMGKLLYINDTNIAVINPPGKVKEVQAPVIAVRR